MAYDESLAKRVRQLLGKRGVATEEKRMMGGLCFMVNGKMCLGVEKDRLLVRLDPAIYEEVLTSKGCVPMDFTGKPMRGFVFVLPADLTKSRDLTQWVDRALEFNPRAVASRSSARVKRSARTGAARR